MQTILVIDDDESLRDTIGLMLENEGFRPILVSDGTTGLEQAFALRPNLILVDLRMPGLSGVEVCKRLRAASMNTPVIVLSAMGDELDKVLLLEIGRDALHPIATVRVRRSRERPRTFRVCKQRVRR